MYSMSAFLTISIDSLSAPAAEGFRILCIRRQARDSLIFRLGVCLCVSLHFLCRTDALTFHVKAFGRPT